VIAMDKEARLDGTTAAEHPEALRLWLRMLTCTQLIEKQVKSGRYSSASEVVQDALLLLEHRDVTGPRKLKI